MLYGLRACPIEFVELSRIASERLLLTTWRTDMNVFTGPNDLLHGDEHLEELEDWELRERFFNALRDLTEAADTVEKLKSPKWTPYPEDIEYMEDTLEELKYSLK
jgi:hypothetical protein